MAQALSVVWLQQVVIGLAKEWETQPIAAAAASAFSAGVALQHQMGMALVPADKGRHGFERLPDRGDLKLLSGLRRKLSLGFLDRDHLLF